MDPRNTSNVGRAGSLGNTPSNRPNLTNQSQPDTRNTTSLNVNRTTSVGQSDQNSQYSNFMRQVPNTTNRTNPIVPRIDNELEGEYYDTAGQNQALLTWSILPENQDLLIEGSSDYNILSKLQNILLALRGDFLSGSGKIVITGDQRQNLNQRMILLESEIDGLMKRKINFTVKDTQGGHRVLDYTNLLNEKENQIIELEKKINNLQDRLRKASARQLELQNHIQLLTADLKRKDEIIKSKNQQILLQVAASNKFKESLNNLRKNINQNRSQLGNNLDAIIIQGVSFPEPGAFEIKADLLATDKNSSKDSSYFSDTSAFKYRTQLVSLFRQFQRLNSTQGITEADFQRVLEGFLIGLRGSRFTDFINLSLQSKKYVDNFNKIKLKLNTAVGLYKSQIEKLKRQNPGLRIQLDKNLVDLLQNDRVTVDRIEGGTVFMERYAERTIEVPVQDARSKHLLHLFAVELRKLSTKYPKILSEMDVRLSEFFQQELIDVIEVDEVDRVVEIVKYVPQIVKVENVYAYSSEKSRKVEFHLRVLVKALLQQLQKLKLRHGLVLDLDEGIIGMINQEIMGMVDVDDILKIFRVVPKIVEVEKIVQKIVDRVVEVPEVIPIQKIVQKIIQVEKIKEVEKIVNIPLELPTVVNNIVQKIVPVETIVEKVIEIPTVTDRIVEVTKEVPKIIEVEVIVQKFVEVEKVIEVEKQINHFIPEIKQVRVQVEKIVNVEKIVQKIVEVPTFVEKIVQRVVEVPQVIEVQKIVQKIVDRVEYKVQKQMIPYVQIQHKIVERIVQKPIPIIQKEEKIIQVVQVIEKIVQVRTVEEKIREIQVFKDNIIIQQRIKEVEKQVPHVVTVKQQVEKIVEKRVQIPIIHQKIVVVPQIITKPIIQKVQNTIVKEVVVRQPLIVKEQTILEVEKPVTHYIDVPRVVKHFQEKIVEVPKHIEVIKEVRVNVDKIIQKMVEVPKVVEVQKIVQKVVVVPRVIQKIVEIPQIVEVPVQKIIIQQVIRQVEKIVQVPVFQQKVVEVQIEKNVYIEVQKVVDRIVDKIVEVPKYEEKIQTVEIVSQRIVEKVIQVPREIQVQKIVTNIVEREHVVEIQRPQVIPVEIKYPVEKIVEKLVEVYVTRDIIQQVPQVIQKIVEVRVPEIEIREVNQVIKEIVVDTQIVEVPHERIVIQDQIKEVEVIREKPVPIVTTVQQIVTAEKIIEKIIEKTIQIPKVYEVEKSVQKIVEMPQIVEIQTLVPQLIRVKEYIQNVVQKIVEVPLILERVKEIEKEKDKVVQVHTTITEIQEVQRIVEKTVILEKFKEAVKNINHIEQVLQVVDRYEQKPVQIHTKQQKLVQVPHILEKIVEKIVVMPQIVEVLKYVHEVVQTQSLGVAVGVDVASHEQKYQLLTKNIQVNLDLLVKELNLLVKNNPALRSQIEIILRFLGQLNQFILFPKIVQIPVQKIVEKVVEKENIIRVPVQDQRSLRMELTLSLLVEKLLIELKRIKKENPSVQFKLDEDVNLIFFSELGLPSNIVSGDLNSQLKTFSDAIQRKFETLGNWTVDHQIMLNSFLQQRFVMANIVKNCNLQIQKAKSISEKRLEGLRRYKSQRMGLQNHTQQLIDALPKLFSVTRNNPETKAITEQIQSILKDYNTFISSQVFTSQQPIINLQNLQITDDRINSLIRTKDAQISKLRDQLMTTVSTQVGKSDEFNKKTIMSLQTENTNLKNQIGKLSSQLNDPRVNASSDVRIRNLSEEVLKLQKQKTDLQNELLNTKNQYKAKLQVAESEIQQYKRFSEPRKTMDSSETPSRLSDGRKEGSDYGTPVTGARRSPNDDIKHIQSGYYATSTPGSSVSQQSVYDKTQSNIGGNTTYGRPTSNTGQTRGNQSISGTTEDGLGSSGGRMTSSGFTGGVNTSYGGLGTGGNNTFSSNYQRSGLEGSSGYATTGGQGATGTGAYGVTETPGNTGNSSITGTGMSSGVGSRFGPGGLGSSYGYGNLSSTYGTGGRGNNSGVSGGTNSSGSTTNPTSGSYSQFSQGGYGRNPTGNNPGSNNDSNAPKRQ